MNQQERFDIIEQLLPTLIQYQKTGNAKIDGNFTDKLQQVYKDITQVPNMDVHCSSCIIHYLSILSSYYDREKPIFDTENKVSEIEQSISPSEEIEKPVVKNKKYKHKK